MTDLDVVIEFLRDDGWPVAVDPDEPDTVGTKAEGDAGIWICVATVDEHHRFVFSSICPTPIPQDRRTAVTELIVRINNRLVLGTIDLDLDSGELRVRSGIDVDGDRLTVALVRNVVYTNVRIMDQYAPDVLAAC